MEEKIIYTAKFSIVKLENEIKSKNKQSFWGALLPLVAPVCILLYMFSKDLKFKELDIFIQLVFWGALICSAIGLALHSKADKLEQEKVFAADNQVSNQSFIITDKRIYGRDKNKEFSCFYCDIDNIYSTQITGQFPLLKVKMSDGTSLDFEYVEDQNTIISLIKDFKEKQSINTAELSGKTVEEDTQRITIQNSNGKSECLLFNVIITSASGSLSQIKAYRTITLCDLKTAQNALANLPCTIAVSKEKAEAESIMRTLEATGMKTELINV